MEPRDDKSSLIAANEVQRIANAGLSWPTSMIERLRCEEFEEHQLVALQIQSAR
jgi:hypothetical protein